MLEKPLGGLICLVSFFGQLILENKNCNSKMLELLQGQLHGLCLMARLIFGCCPPCKGDIDETACHSTLGTATGAALKICERRQVKLCLYVTVPASWGCSNTAQPQTLFLSFQTPPQFGYLCKPREKPCKHWLALTLNFKEDKRTFGEGQWREVGHKFPFSSLLSP